MRRLRVLRATTAPSGCLGVLLFLGGAPAHAHTALEDASPGPGDTVGAGAELVSLTFGQLKPGTTPKISLIGPDGTAVPIGKPIVADGSVTCAAVAGLPIGVNTLTYSITSADGDSQDSAFQFEVAKGAATAEPATACQKLSLPEPGTGTGSDMAEDDAFLGLGRTTALALLAGAIAVIAGAGFRTVRMRGTRTTTKGKATT
ncbi:copper resistance protein CopC [Streptomyces scabiei]|uniref:copper resistance CopC family protein n=1 Tax=Streptomyces scabiei TaxID=1930 RepID=UPI00298F711E|nr:copper resistance protein CopC [Streptomyces scabiei]MDW8805288.1 copper resistance protein CopC [Streptomyces scabiei]